MGWNRTYRVKHTLRSQWKGPNCSKGFGHQRDTLFKKAVACPKWAGNQRRDFLQRTAMLQAPVCQ
eukprot:834152-Alexandrium_andersonii.AAC.1